MDTDDDLIYELNNNISDQDLQSELVSCRLKLVIGNIEGV